MLVREWIKAQGTTEITPHKQVNRVVNLLAEEDFDLLQIQGDDKSILFHMARRDDKGREENAMVICLDLDDPKDGYVQRDHFEGHKAPPRVALADYGPKLH